MLHGFDFAALAAAILLEDHVGNLAKHRFMKGAGYRLICRRVENNGWYVPRDAAGAAAPRERWDIVRKYYFGLPFRMARNVSRAAPTPSGALRPRVRSPQGGGTIARRLSVRRFRRARERPSAATARSTAPTTPSSLVALGVAVERAFEISQRDHEPRPAVAVAVLEQVVLDECPDPVPQRPAMDTRLPASLRTPSEE